MSPAVCRRHKSRMNDVSKIIEIIPDIATAIAVLANFVTARDMGTHFRVIYENR